MLKTVTRFLAISIITVFLLTSIVYAVNVRDGDANNDGQVNVEDIKYVMNYWLASRTDYIDQYQDGKINAFDFATILSKIQLSLTPTTSQQPTIPSGSASGEWTQHAHDAQRTSYTSQSVPSPWRWKWSWNGPNSSGGISSGKSGLPRNVQPVTGGGRVYIAAGNRGVFALNESNGSVVWNASNIGIVNSTVAYDSVTNSVFVYTTTGVLYKLNAINGSVAGQIQGSGSSNAPLPPAVIQDRIFFASGNNVYAVNKQTMQVLWTYGAGAVVHTPPAFSSSHNMVVVATSDLFVHAVNNTNGSRVWRVKPATVTAGSPNEYLYGWPVIADVHGLVLMKIRLNWQTMWTWNPWPVDNAAMRSNLQSKPDQQALFAMKLEDGSIPFITNIGHGGYGDNDFMPMGPQPVVKRFSDNTEVAYTIIRGSTEYDGRWDSHFGEMLLDSTTLPGYQAGYVRFIEYLSQSQYLLTDEQPQVSMAGDYLFGGHWMAGLSLRISDRSGSRGSYGNRIQSVVTSHIVTSASNCAFNTSHHCSNLTQDGDPRTFPAGFYIYHGQGTIYDAYWGSYASWIVSNNSIYFRSNDGAIIALESGNPTAVLPMSRSEVASASTIEGEIRNPGAKDMNARGSDVIPYAEAADHIGEIKTVEGIIRHVSNNYVAVLLGFSSPHMGTFKIKINKEHWSKFKVIPDIYFNVGQKVRVNGKIVWYQGDPAIYVDNPSHIKIMY